MDLNALFAELEQLGRETDAKAIKKEDKYLNITRATGAFLAVLVKACAAKTVLEVGTSNGYSTLWIAAALPQEGHVTTLERMPNKTAQAIRNFERAGLSSKITVEQADAANYLRRSCEPFDMIFLDADRSQYMDFARQLLDRLRPGGLLVCDNAVSHASELEPFMRFVAETERFTIASVPVGKGEFLACKHA